jgi:hypothetical protein
MNQRKATSAAAWALGTILSASGVGTAEASLFLAFTPDPARAGGISPEGCYTEPGLARGLLTASSAESFCHNGQLGSVDNGLIVGQAPTESVAMFTTGELTSALSVGGRATLVVYHNVQASDRTRIGGQDLIARLDYKLREKHPAGSWTTIASGTAFSMRANGGRGEVSFDVPAYTLSPGGRLQVLLFSPDAPGGRVFFGGAPLIDDASAGNAMYYSSYADAGITLGGAPGPGVDPGSDPDPVVDTGQDEIPAIEPPSSEPPQQDPASADSASGGALGAGLLLPMLAAGFARRRSLSIGLLSFGLACIPFSHVATAGRAS